MTKYEALITLSLKILEERIKPVVDKSLEMKRRPKPIPYNPSLDENDYLEYIAAKEGILVHLMRKED